MDAKFYMKNLSNFSKKNSEEENENELFKSIISDIFIDVGEFPLESNFLPLDENTALKIKDKCLLIKSGRSYYPKQGDSLLSEPDIYNSIYVSEPQGIEPNTLLACFGSIIWDYDGNKPELGSANILFLVRISDERYGLINYEM